MFQIVESFSKNVASRDPIINWLCQMVVLNVKRAGMHVVESEVASAGFYFEHFACDAQVNFES